MQIQKIDGTSFGTKVPTRNIAANMMDIFTIHGNRWGSQLQKEKTCMMLTGRKYTGDFNTDSTSRYLACTEVRNAIKNRYPELAEKFDAKRSELVKKYGWNVFGWSGKEMRKELNKFTKELGMGDYLDISFSHSDKFVK